MLAYFFLGCDSTFQNEDNTHNQTFIGAGAVILPGVTIGEKVTISANTKVEKDVSSEQVIYGN